MTAPDLEGSVMSMPKKTSGYFLDGGKKTISLATTASVVNPPVDHVAGIWTIPQGCVLEIRKLKGGVTFKKELI
jgi:hypothetical protein